MTYRLTPFGMGLLAKRRALNAVKGVALIYCTDAAEIPVTGRPGKTVFHQVDYNGVRVIEYRRDFLIDVDQLVDPLTGSRFCPLDGHQVKEPIGAGAFAVYVVRPVGSEPSARYSDTTETEWRIHTIRIEEEPQP